MVKSDIKSVSNCKKEIFVTMPETDVSEIRQKEVKKMQKKAQLPGFRKGKVPLPMVTRTFGHEIEQNTLDTAMNIAIRQVVEQEKLNIVGTPALKKFDLDDDKNLTMEFEVEIYPEIELKKYKNLSLTKEVYTVSDKEVEDALLNIRNERATVKNIDGQAEKDHIVWGTLQELDESGMPIVGKKYENLQIKIGSGMLDEELEKQLKGIKKGDVRSLSKTYPKNHPQKQVACKTEKFTFTADKVEELILPELTDEFAQELNEKYKTVNDLKKDLHKNLELDFGRQTDEKFFRVLAQELIQQNPFEIPEALIQNYLDYILQDIRQRDPNVNEESVRKNYRNEAIFNLKWMYLREKISETESIKVEDSDIEDYMKMFKDEKMVEQIRGNENFMRRVQNDVYEKKVLTFLTENQKIKEKKVKINSEQGA